MSGSKKISQLTELTLLADEDYIEIVDSSETSQDLKNKFTTLSTLRGFLNATTASSDVFEDWDSETTYDPEDGDQYVFYNGVIYYFISESTSLNERPDLYPLVWDQKTATDFVHVQNTDQYLDFGGANQVAVADVFLKTGARAMTGNLDMATNYITNVGSIEIENGGTILNEAGNITETFGATGDYALNASGTVTIEGSDIAIVNIAANGGMIVNSSGRVDLSGVEIYATTADGSWFIDGLEFDLTHDTNINLNAPDIYLTAAENISIQTTDPGATLLEIDSNGGNLLLQSSNGGNVDIKALGGGNLSLTGDISFKDVTDDTKVLTHDVSGITTATTRTVTWQDKNITVADNADLRGFTLDVANVNLSPADGATYYAGFFLSSTSTTDGDTAIPIPRSGTLKRAYVVFTNQGTLGSAETSSVYVRINTTDTLISNAVTTNTTWQVFSNTALNLSVTAGDKIQLKWIAPAYATNPTNVRFQAIFYFEA